MTYVGGRDRRGTVRHDVAFRIDTALARPRCSVPECDGVLDAVSVDKDGEIWLQETKV